METKVFTISIRLNKNKASYSHADFSRNGVLMLEPHYLRSVNPNEMKGHDRHIMVSRSLNIPSLRHLFCLTKFE